MASLRSERDDDDMLWPGIRAMGNVASGSDQATQVLVDSGGLAVLLKLLRHPRIRIQKEVFWALSNVSAGTVPQKQVQDGSRLYLYDSFFLFV